LPEPADGIEGFKKYLMNALRYPKIARKKGIQGKVFVQFVVERDGTLSSVELIRGIGGGCDEEAMRVIAKCPKWLPAIQRGQEVRVRMSIPIVFKLG
jgi:protein TonB